MELLRKRGYPVFQGKRHPRDYDFGQKEEKNFEKNDNILRRPVQLS